MLMIKELTKRYGGFTAVNHLNMHIAKGEIFGFVGPNGAGKTTTMRICCGLLKATAGEVYIDGINAFTNPVAIKRKVGYVPDFFGVYDNLKVIEYMEFFGSMYNMKREQVRDISRNLLKLVDLAGREDAFVDSLSRGMKQRLCVARALIHNPELLILDEPNSGLDPRARFEIKEIIKNLGAMGKTVLISSHILPELSEMCTGIAVMERGRLVLKENVGTLVTRSEYTQPVKVKLVSGTADDKERTVMLLKENPLTEKVLLTEEEILVYFNGDEAALAVLIKYLIQNDLPISGFHRDKGDLESLFLNVTGKNEKKR